MGPLNDVLFIFIPSFLAGVLCSQLFLSDWGYKYHNEKEGERIVKINCPMQMRKYWRQNGIDISLTMYQEWKQSFITNFSPKPNKNASQTN